MKRIIDFFKKAYDRLLRRITGEAVWKDPAGRLHINADVIVHGNITSLPNQD